MAPLQKLLEKAGKLEF